MKRFTDTEKFEKPWFRKLPPKSKVLWDYLCCACDHAGVLDPDWELMSFLIGEKVTESDLDGMNGNVVKLGRKLFIPGFVRFQYGKLSRECKPHIPVFDALERHGLKESEILQNEKYIAVVEGYLRDKIINRDGFVCAYSGEKIDPWDAEIDHVVPRSMGGMAVPQNLVVASSKMNRLKSDLPLDEFCSAQNLDIEKVKNEIRKRTSKPIEGYRVAFERVQDKDKEKDKEKEQPKIDALQLPDDLLGMADTWSKWVAFRKELRKPLTPTSAQQQFKKF